MILQIDGRGTESSEIIALLKRPSQLDFPEEGNVVKEILSEIKSGGSAALFKYIEQFDGVNYKDPQKMLVSGEEIKTAYTVVSKGYIDIIDRAMDRIARYHKKQKQNSWISFEDDSGVVLGQKIEPMEWVGMYVPGGRAAYPSSVLMNAIPAEIAGVDNIIMATPPGPGGVVNPYTLVAADMAGIGDIYKMGGAQSIAAMAFGIEPVPKVDKITGPGNIYVTLAKKEVYGYVDIDMIAGPSEVVVIADSSANREYVAADLLSQAEHDPLATSVLITDNIDLYNNIGCEIERQAKTLPKLDIVEESLSNFGAIILVDNIELAIELSNYIAPEHLELAIENPFEKLGKVKNAGSIFLGHYSPEPLGDYMAGPNHILPTSGSARYFSPLSVDDFIKKSSILSFSKEALEDLYKDVADFARIEGLEAHARSVEARFRQ
ncbi:MAG TPA: histidinol dehydrogenase [Clostridia bacterium]|nr:histidinol dehydrogenase [Clostridia bacterium]